MALWRWRLPFLVMPVALTLWYLGMVALALWTDLRSRAPGGSGQDYGLWLHLFGVASACGALTAMDSTSEWGRLGYCAINVAMILFGAVIGRPVWAVFGAFGVAAYLGHLAFTLFPDSLLLPFALSLIGLGVIGL